MTRGHGHDFPPGASYPRAMNVSELRAIQKPVHPVASEEIPPELADRARAYNAAVDAFHELVRGALAALERGQPVAPESAAALRSSAQDLVTARDWLLDLARLPLAKRIARP